MARNLDWLISTAITAIILMAHYRLVLLGVFERLPLAFSIVLLLLVRALHQHLPRLIAAKYKW